MKRNEMDDEKEILDTLIRNPTNVYVSSDGTKLYMLKSATDRLMYVAIGNFNGWTEDQINKYIQYLFS